MPTEFREQYQAALVALDVARQAMRRADLMAHIALNRVRQAEEEGFDDEASRREDRRVELERAYDAEVANVARLNVAVEQQRLLAAAEEIDEIALAYDGALHKVLEAVTQLTNTLTEATRLAERGARLAATLPPTERQPHAIAAAAVDQSRAIQRHVDRLIDAVISQPMPEHRLGGEEPRQ